MNDDRSNFEQIFNVRAVILKTLSFIHSPLKVDHFELFMN